MISGERVRQARELRGMKQSDLAAEIGVSQAFIARIETGSAQPSEETMSALSTATQFPTAFFRQSPPIDFPTGSLLYRARTSATTGEKWKAYRYAQLLFELALTMERQFDEREVKIPRISRNPAEFVDYAYAAHRTRDAMGLSPDLPIENLIREIERKGSWVLSVPVRLIGIDAFATWAGVDYPKPVIVLSDGAPGDRLRWSVAHELGHLVLHQAPDGTLGQVEHEADQFAAEFLMPEIAMRKDLVPPITLTDLAKLKLRWKVSMQSLIRRAHDLAIITDRQYRYLFEQLSTYGWRTKEPSNLDIPVEKPRAFREMAEILYQRPIDYERLAHALRLSVNDARIIMETFAGKAEVQAKPISEGLDSGKILPFVERK